MIVIKVGGSLFDHPDLSAGLLAFMNFPRMDGWPYLIVPGGGSVADVVRQWHRVHGFDESRAHGLALRAMSLTARFLKTFLAAAVVSHPLEDPPIDFAPKPAVRILDAFEFCQRDDALPHSWDVTSDSIAARAAAVGQAKKLVLLKSIEFPSGPDWRSAATNGWVDRYFPTAVVEVSCPVEVINFRRWLDESLRSE